MALRICGPAIITNAIGRIVRMFTGPTIQGSASRKPSAWPRLGARQEHRAPSIMRFGHPDEMLPRPPEWAIGLGSYQVNLSRLTRMRRRRRFEGDWEWR